MAGEGAVDDQIIASHPRNTELYRPDGLVSTRLCPTVVGMSDARRRILDSYAQILRESGSPAATLDAVAAHAEVSKGGLLYHFGSKAKLASGLAELLNELVATDVEIMSSDPAGPVDYLLRTSDGSDSAFALIYEAVCSLAMEGHDEARDTIDAAQKAWESVLVDVGIDLAMARIIVLLSDGLSMRASVGLVYGDSENEPGNMRDLMRVVNERMLDDGGAAAQ